MLPRWAGAIAGVLLCWLGYSTAQAQNLSWQQLIPLVAYGDTLRNGWAGGLNAPQFSAVDLNADGHKDLVVFDKADAAILPFVRIQDSTYRFAPEYIPRFPQRPYGTKALLVDYDADGREDLVQDTLGTLQVLHNVPDAAGKPTFKPAYPMLKTLFHDGAQLVAVPVYSGPDDLPALVDVDADGDLDVLGWNAVGGTQVNYYKNFAQELFHRHDTLALQTASQCWGHFAVQSFLTTGVRLHYPYCNGPEFKTEHEGGGILALNLNGDTLMDALISDPGTPTVAAIYNGGSKRFADIAAYQNEFPASYPVNIYVFPGMFYLDVTGDGVPDLVTAPNEAVGTQDRNGVWLYRNNGLAAKPDFQLIKKNFLQGQQLDAGSGALPSFFDQNNDGLQDLLVGCESERTATGGYQSRIRVWRNTGSAALPAFTLVDEDFLNLASEAATDSLRGFCPAFGDLDNDGLQDLVLGSYNPQGNSTLRYYHNESLPNSPAQLVLREDNFLGLDAEGQSRLAPTLADVDLDGDLDLVVGTAAGTLYFYLNEGNLSNPRFRLVSRSWGAVTVGVRDSLHSFVGNAHPLVVDLNGDHRPDLLVGAADGLLHAYTQLAVDAAASFPSLTWQLTSVGAQAAPAAAQLDSTGNTTLVLGTWRGGLQYVQLPAQLYHKPAPYGYDLTIFHLYPNPANHQVTLQAPPATDVQVFTLLGQPYYHAALAPAQEKLVWDVTRWPTGTYLVRCSSSVGSATLKLVITP